ncbi:MAG: hypothetical protein K0U29_03795 [Gammaproteobacteria bacterium]|nr:hypothetical protein [Gammaproteobacteria bacterium]MCH9744036.1 hypothetical protein [Gammaproteobacteria bacterium]
MRIDPRNSFEVLAKKIAVCDCAYKMFSPEDLEHFFAMLNKPGHERPFPKVASHRDILLAGEVIVDKRNPSRILRKTVYFKADYCDDPREESFVKRHEILTEFNAAGEILASWRLDENGVYQQRGVKKVGAWKTKPFSSSLVPPSGGAVFSKQNDTGLFLDPDCFVKPPITYKCNVVHFNRFDTTWSLTYGVPPKYHQYRVNLNTFKVELMAKGLQGASVEYHSELVGRAHCGEKKKLVVGVYVHHDYVTSRVVGIRTQQKTFKELGARVPILVHVADWAQKPEAERPNIAYREYTPTQQWLDILTITYRAQFKVAGKGGATPEAAQAILDDLDFSLFDAVLFDVDAVYTALNSPDGALYGLADLGQKLSCITYLAVKAKSKGNNELEQSLVGVNNRLLKYNAKELVSKSHQRVIDFLLQSIKKESFKLASSTATVLIQELSVQGHLDTPPTGESNSILFHACLNGSLDTVKAIAAISLSPAVVLNTPVMMGGFEWLPIYSAACRHQWHVIDYIFATFLESDPQQVLTQDQLRQLDECLQGYDDKVQSLSDAPAQYENIKKFVEQNKEYYYPASAIGASDKGKRAAVDAAEPLGKGKKPRKEINSDGASAAGSAVSFAPSASFWSQESPVCSGLPQAGSAAARQAK